MIQKTCSLFAMTVAALVWAIPVPVEAKHTSSNSHHCHKSSHEHECDAVHVIDCVPYLIKKPGKYCVKKDLVYNGAGPAIMVIADNVTLNFSNHSLILNNPNAVGVYADSIKELAIENDIIQAPVVSTNSLNAAIQLYNCQKVTLDSVYTLNTFYGVLIQESEDVFITHSEFRDHIGGAAPNLSFGIRVEASNNIVVEDSSFFGTSPNEGIAHPTGPITYRDGCKNCRVSGCQMTDVDIFYARQIDGLIIEDCSFLGGTNAVYAKIQLGSVAEVAEANDIIIRNCTFHSESTNNDETLIFTVHGTDCLIENCVLNLSGNPGGNPLGVGPFFNNVTARDCIIQASPGGYAVAIDIFGGVHNTVIDNCQISGGGPNGVPYPGRRLI